MTLAILKIDTWQRDQASWAPTWGRTGPKKSVCTRKWGKASMQTSIIPDKFVRWRVVSTLHLFTAIYNRAMPGGTVMSLSEHAIKIKVMKKTSSTGTDVHPLGSSSGSQEQPPPAPPPPPHTHILYEEIYFFMQDS